MIIILIISLFTTREVLIILGISEYGVYNVVAGFVSMFLFLNTSMASATQRFYNVELSKNGLSGARKVYCASLKIHTILGFSLSCVTLPIGYWYICNKMVLPEHMVTPAIYVFVSSVLSLFLNIVTTPFIAAVMAHEKMDFFAGIEILNSVLKLLSVYALYIVPNNRLVYYGIFNSFVSIIILLLYQIYCNKKFLEIKYGATISKDFYHEMISFSGWSVIGALCYTLRDQGINLVLNSFYGTIVNAARGVSNQINSALQGLIGNLVTPARPQIMQSYACDNIQRSWSLTYCISKVSCIFFFMISVPLCLEIGYVLHLWLGNDIPEFTGIFVILLLATNTFGTLVQPLSIMIQATGKVKFYQIISGISNFATVPLAYIFIKILRTPTAAYYALFITMLTNLLCCLVATHRLLSISYFYYLRRIIFPCLFVMILSLPIICIPQFMFPEGVLRLLLEFSLSVIVVTVIGYYIALSTPERVFILSAVKGGYNKLRRTN